jgi:hypothetical protein
MDEDTTRTEEADEHRPAGESTWLNRLLDRLARVEQWDELHNECLYFPYACY